MSLCVNLFLAILMINVIVVSETRAENDCKRTSDRVTTTSDLADCCKRLFVCKCQGTLCNRTHNLDSNECVAFKPIEKDCFDFSLRQTCLSVSEKNFNDKCAALAKDLTSILDGKNDPKVEKNEGHNDSTKTIAIAVIVVIVLLVLIGICIFWWVFRGKGQKHSSLATTRKKNRPTKATAANSEQSIGSNAKRTSKKATGGGKSHKADPKQKSKKATHQQSASNQRGSFDSRAIHTRILPKADNEHKCGPSHESTKIKKQLV